MVVVVWAVSIFRPDLEQWVPNHNSLWVAAEFEDPRATLQYDYYSASVRAETQ